MSLSIRLVSGAVDTDGEVIVQVRPQKKPKATKRTEWISIDGFGFRFRFRFLSVSDIIKQTRYEGLAWDMV